MSNIPLQQLEEMFAGMRAQTPWNVDGDMLWGYFFADSDPRKLDSVAEHLARKDYRVVGIYETDDGSTHILQVERVETHTPRTLDARNAELEKLAGEFGLASYDGMDVGPATKDPPVSG